MWLLDTTTIKLRHVSDLESTKYAILSHTWEDDEVSFQDMQGEGFVAQAKKGYQKILWTCQQAAYEGIPYVWVDTCCLDKKSSAELSEAINSMFRWYNLAAICYVYLSDTVDIERTDPESHGVNAPDQDLNAYFCSIMGQCRWLSRGWTLQELLAPGTISFYRREWSYIGSKNNMAKALSRMTRVPTDVLYDLRYIWQCVVGPPRMEVYTNPWKEEWARLRWPCIDRLPRTRS